MRSSVPGFHGQAAENSSEQNGLGLPIVECMLSFRNHPQHSGDALNHFGMTQAYPGRQFVCTIEREKVPGVEDTGISKQADDTTLLNT